MNDKPINNRQPAYRRLSTRDSSRAIDSPLSSSQASSSRQPTPSHSQQPLGLSLFESLIFDRQGVYQALSKVPFAPRPQPTPTLTPALPTGTDRSTSVTQIAEVSDHGVPRDTPLVRAFEERRQTSAPDDTCMLRALHNPMAPVSKTPKAVKPRGRPKKAVAAGKATDDKGKKRGPSKSAPSRVSKIQKTEANSKKKVDNSSLTRNIMSPVFASRSLSTGPGPTEIIDLISDDDEEEYYNNDVELDDETEVDEPLIVAKARLQPKAEATQIPIFQDAVDEDGWDFTGFHVDKLDSPDTDSDHLSAPRKSSQEDRRRKDIELEQELRQLREHFDASKAEAARKEEEWTKKFADEERKFVRMSSEKNRDLARLEQRLRSEEEKVRFVIREKDQQGINLDNMTTNFEEERRLRLQEKKEHERTLEDIQKKANAEKPTEDFLVTENARLRQEVERLKPVASSTKNRAPTTPPSSYPPGSIFNTSSQNRATLSPAPSISSSNDEEKKEENIRKTYLTVKKRFDNLHSAAVKIRTCTQSMDLSSFGEFGQYVRQLRKALDDDGKEARQAMAARLRDYDDAK